VPIAKLNCSNRLRCLGEEQVSMRELVGLTARGPLTPLSRTIAAFLPVEQPPSDPR
jgi:hypothetical protein